MNSHISIVLKTLILGFLIVTSTANASSAKLDDAIKVYYAGLPDQAIDMIKPLAQSGNIKAQLLLGNILHSLSRSETTNTQEDPIAWYQMAAAQGSPEANYLLGVIYHNKWANTQEQGSNTRAIAYYETASKLGNLAAQGPLIQLKYRDKTANKKSKPLVKPKIVEAPEEKAPEVIASIKIEEPKTIKALNAIPENEKEPEEPLLEADVKKVIEASIEDEEVASNAVLTEDTNEVLREVDLLDVVTECKNFTQAGFVFYADSIKNSHLTGSANRARYQIRQHLDCSPD